MSKHRDRKPSWVFYTEWASTLGVLLGGFFFLYSQLSSLDGKLDIQGARTDKLYEMFICLQKETTQMVHDFQIESMKERQDFHGRLCKIEEQRGGK